MRTAKERKKNSTTEFYFCLPRNTNGIPHVYICVSVLYTGLESYRSHPGLSSLEFNVEGWQMSDSGLTGERTFRTRSILCSSSDQTLSSRELWRHRTKLGGLDLPLLLVWRMPAQTWTNPTICLWDCSQATKCSCRKLALKQIYKFQAELDC